MLIYRFHHPLLHNTTRMRFMNINILSRLFIFKISRENLTLHLYYARYSHKKKAILKFPRR